MDETRAKLWQYLSERSHWLVLLLPALQDVLQELTHWWQDEGLGQARAEVFLVTLSEWWPDGRQLAHGTLTILALPRAQIPLPLLQEALQVCAGLEDVETLERLAEAPGRFVLPVPEGGAAEAWRLMDLFQRFLMGEGRWEEVPTPLPRRIGHG